MELSRSTCIDEVAGDQKSQDLSLTVWQEAIAAGHAACDNERRTWRVAFDQDVYIALEAFFARTQRLQHADVLVRERCELQELRYERILRAALSILRSLRLHSVRYEAAQPQRRLWHLLTIARLLARRERAI
jgi:hypothetical protein